MKNYFHIYKLKRIFSELTEDKITLPEYRQKSLEALYKMKNISFEEFKSHKGMIEYFNRVGLEDFDWA